VLNGKDKGTDMNFGDADDLRSGRVVVNERDTVSQAIVDKLPSRRFSLEGLGTDSAETGVSAVGGDVDGDGRCDTSSILKANEELAIPQRVRKVEEDRDCVLIHGRVVGLSS